ncbi:MAG: nucleotidyltransferase family protein [Chloroflexi bacterium]|nr:nucleotidyltransferase family protein [Chloroflexota bacterium]
MGRSEIVAIILAAGYSNRMERFKPLLDLGGRPVISHVVGTFIGAGIHDVRVVVGYNRDVLTPLLDQMGARSIVNDNYADGMFSSVLAGVKRLEPAVKAFFILPVDVPLVKPKTIRQLAENYMCNQGKILVPYFGGRSGHPPLIASKFIKGIIDYDGNGGLKGALRQFESETIMMPVPDENILFDIDLPVDYAKMLERWKNGSPSPKRLTV